MQRIIIDDRLGIIDSVVVKVFILTEEGASTVAGGEGKGLSERNKWIQRYSASNLGS